MIGRVKAAWAWFVDGLTDALLRVLDRAGGARVWRVEVGSETATLRAPDGAAAGGASGPTADTPARFDPSDLGRRLKGAAVDLVVPAAWMLRRDLDAVAVGSVPFLDAFVRHQIERITPWKVGDVHYRSLQRPIPGDPGRVAVAVVAVPRRLVAPWIGLLNGCAPRRVRVVAEGGAEDRVVDIGDDRAGRSTLRRGVVFGLVGTALVATGAIGLLQWQTGLVRADVEEQGRLADERRTTAQRARQRAQLGKERDGELQRLRAARPATVDVIDALAAALPDSAHLTDLSIDKTHVTITGVSTDPSALVPALETSGRFAGVSFGAATTRVEAGEGDRFQLDMEAVAPAQAGALAATP